MPPQTPPNRQEEFTDADMYIINARLSNLAVEVTDNKNMSSTFAPQTILSGGTASGYVKAGDWPSQSSFKISFNNLHETKVDVGTGIYKTDASPASFTDGQAGLVLAPGKPFSTGKDFRFYFLAGEGTGAPLLNSFLNANIAALAAFVNKEQPTIDSSDEKLSIEIRSLELASDAVSCAFGDISESSTGSSKYTAHAILDVAKIKIKGAIKYGDISDAFHILFEGLSLYSAIDIDASGVGGIPSINISTLQFSLKKYDIGGVIIDILEIFFPLLAILIRQAASAYHIAGALNTYVNDAIIEAINGLLKKILPSKDMVVVAGLECVARDFQSRDDTSYATWMSDPKIQSKRLKDICIPGTHDSATYNLSNILSSIKYDDIAFLWCLSPENAPADGSNPFNFPLSDSNPIHVGKILYDFILQIVVNNVSKAQGQSILEQLEGGIRSFDLRVYYDERDGGGFYTQHALRGPKLDDVLSQVKAHIDAYPDARELVYLFVSHANFSKYPSKWGELSSLVEKTIGSDHIFWKSGGGGTSRFDFQSLGNTALSSITSGGSKVMIVNCDPDVFFPEEDAIIKNSYGFKDRPWSGGATTVKEMTDQEGPALMANRDPMYMVHWNIALDTASIVHLVLSILSGQSKWVLQEKASEANAAFKGFCNSYPGSFQAVAVDWFMDRQSGPSIVEYVIGRNMNG